MIETHHQSCRRRWLLVALLLVATVVSAWFILSAKPAGRVDVQFLGYAFDTPSFELGSFAYGGRTSSAKRGARVARFFITNGCDYPVLCSLIARYTNGFGSFAPRDISLEPHGFTNITGLASPPAGSALANSRVPSGNEWTNACWQLTIASRNALPFQGIDQMRYRTALWLFKRKLHRLGRFVNPVKIQATETGLLPPDVPSL
ncbi:MAG TPA: hypothetical protein VNT99_05105 [Methylomirabilota bacterium]|nr:hypothetical protein [Methylomirabilota bacterium]